MSRTSNADMCREKREQYSLESPPVLDSVPLKGAGAPIHEYDMVGEGVSRVLRCVQRPDVGTKGKGWSKGRHVLEKESRRKRRGGAASMI